LRLNPVAGQATVSDLPHRLRVAAQFFRQAHQQIETPSPSKNLASADPAHRRLNRRLNIRVFKPKRASMSVSICTVNNGKPWPVRL